jgi:acylphosphatase
LELGLLFSFVPAICPARLNVLLRGEMKTIRKFRVEGRVQGVWFRESTRQQAEGLGLSGHAINQSDGSVEVLASGEAEEINKLAEWLRQGPPMAQVTSVTERDYDGACPAGFRTG